ncbi:hypothetical protein PBRA_009647 [Plasmodiophora brassicae]|uniref:Uncharacterized protein n=1 Tax=Plasmodiophora brassicae TaxID=37360 RepID=A0A0G4IJG3_PLABS|nr:hypothetical protein PBRA_009647 [Plasmodiophora brassicae]
MVLRIARKYQDVVEVHEDEYVQVVPEQVVHEPLECGGSIGQPERHHQVLEESKRCAKRGFPFVAFPDPDLMVGRAEIDLGEYLGRA